MAGPGLALEKLPREAQGDKAPLELQASISFQNFPEAAGDAFKQEENVVS